MEKRLDESALQRVEREVMTNFKSFNRAAISAMLQHVTTEGVNYPALVETFRNEVFSFSSDLQNVYLNNGRLTAQKVSADLGRTIDYDMFNPGTATKLQMLRNRVVQGLMQQQAQAIAILRQNLANQTPIRAVKEIQESITLAPRQIVWIKNYRDALETNNSAKALSYELRDKRYDSSVNRAAKADQILDSTKIDTMVSRYAQRQLNYRARTIAATEAVKIANESDHDFYQQAVSRGDIEADKVIRSWTTSKDEVVRGTHKGLADTEAKLNEPWTTDKGNVLMYPGDPNAPAEEVISCRCWVTTRIAA